MIASKKPIPLKEGADVRAGLYVRVSTSQQVEKESLSNQESRLKAYCQANGFQVHTVYKDEGVSAKDTDRPELKRLFEDCRKGRVQVVLVTALESREDRERGIDVGANAYIVKSSFDQSNLLEVMRRLL